MPKATRPGIQTVLPNAMTRGGPLRAEVILTIVGTGSVAWVPVSDESLVEVQANWPHPAFGGSFLPIAREVGPQEFRAGWQVSALATSARQALDKDATFCASPNDGSIDEGRGTCVENFGVRFIDPIDSYVLTDRATKYGVLFIALTFVGVGLAELMSRRRVHPMQYLLVGCALSLFYLLLVSLSEHVGFALAYLCASAACTVLLTLYGVTLLKGVRGGIAFGAAIATLYGTLYALLQLEQTALLLGSILLFAALAAVMLATRRLDWYALPTRRLGDADAGPESV